MSDPEDQNPSGNLESQVEELRNRLEESEQLLDALRNGDIDGFVLTDNEGNRLLTLDEADSIYRLLVEEMAESALTLSADGAILYSNRRFSSLVDTDPERIVGTPFVQWLDVQSGQRVQGMLNAGGEVPARGEISLSSASGSRIAGYISLTEINVESVPVRYCVIVTDLTEHKRHQAIAESEQLARAILEQMTEAIIVTDADGRVFRASEAAMRLGSSSPVGFHFDEVFVLEDDMSRGIHWSDIAVANTGKKIYADIKSINHTVNLQISSGPLRGPENVVIGTVIVLADITDRKQAEITAEIAREEAEQALQKSNQSRRALLSVVEDQKLTEKALKESEARFRLVLEKSPISVFSQDSDLRYTWIYDPSSGFTTETIAGKTDYDLFKEEDASRLSEIKQAVLDTGKPAREEVSITVNDSVRTFDITIEPLRDYAGDITGLSAATVDITDRKVAEEKISVAATVFEQGGEGIVITDTDNNIIMVNKAFTEITGYEENEVIGRNPELLSAGHEDGDFYRKMWESINNEGYWHGEMWSRRKDGSVYPEWLTISTRQDSNGGFIGYIGIFTDISQRKKAEEHINWLAHFDSLTELPNRTLFHDRMANVMSLARRNKDHVSLCFLDLDNFKNINDTLGHHVGDSLLVQLAGRITSVLREEDTASRQGGDEFVILLPSTNAEGASHVAEKLMRVCSMHYEIDGHNLVVTASIGIAVYPENGATIEELSRHADIAMYRAKRMGRNNYCFYTPEMQSVSTFSLQLESDIRRVLDEGGLELHYQPQISLVDGRIAGGEALLRWRHPEFGMISPIEFIPIAENSGQIIPIGNWVIRTAARQLKIWMESGLPSITIAVNLSIRQLREPGLIETVENVIEETGVSPHQLELELTESMLMENQNETIEILNRLSDIGVQLAIDDFGTGYSSLSYLKRLPVDRLKIDKSFVKDMARSHDDAIIARSIITLGHSLGMKIIAEGVETGPQLDFLKAHSCDEIQGYLFSKPLVVDEFTRMLTEDRRMPLLMAGESGDERTLLIVDDERNITRALERVLRGEGYRILTASSGEEGLDTLALNKVDVILSDQRMPGMSGVDFLNRVKEIYPDTVRLVLSGYTDIDTITSAINRGDIYKFLSKPWDDDLLRANIREAFQHYNVTNENSRLARMLKEANKALARLERNSRQ